MDILSGESYENEIMELILEYTNSLGRDLTFQNPFDNGRCEMKRLFVKPEYRCLHIGQALVEAAIDTAGTASGRGGEVASDIPAVPAASSHT